MNTILKHFIKISLMLVLLLQAGRVEAQWSGSYTTYSLSLACLPANSIWIGSGLPYPTAATAISNTATYTFATPVTGFKILLGAFDAGTGISGVSKTEIKINGVHYNVTNSDLTSCGYPAPAIYVADANGYIRSNELLTNGASSGSYLTIYSSTNITSFSVGTNDNNGVFVSSVVTPLTCSAGATAPVPSAITIANNCTSSSSVNLNSLVATTPTGASLQWYSDNTHTNAVTTPTAVTTSGTYYAFYMMLLITATVQ